MNEDAFPVVDNSDPDGIRLNTSKQLFEIVSATYKEQADLDESVWRAMPFIAALFAIAVTFFRFIEPHFSFSGAALVVVSSLLFCLSLASFALAFVFFVAAVWTRKFEYPSASTQIRDYAASLTIWHRSAGTPDGDIDDQVVNDLRLFMINQISEANKTNLELVRKRLSARSRTIMWMLVGFAFVLANELVMLIARSFGMAGG